MRKNLYFLVFALIYLLYSNNLYATHLRAGDITAKVIDFKTRTYQFTLTLYRDRGGVDQLEASLNFGDGTPCQKVKLDERNRVVVSPATERLIFYFNHSFSGDGTYTVSFNEENRNPNINNVNEGNSVQISFYVETQLTIDAFNGANNTPQLLIPPIDQAAQNEIFYHNPGAYDRDGDSLAYRLTVSKAFIEGETGCGSGDPFVVPNYRLPNDPIFNGRNKNGGAATFTLDPITGDLVWNTPGKEGEYNMAFVVEEWRKINGEWVKLGFVTRDMQVTVKKTDNTPPLIEIPNDTCIVAGSKLAKTIKAWDEDTLPGGKKRDSVFLYSFSGLYETTRNNHATFIVNPNKRNPVFGNFNWESDTTYIREKPYQVIFQASDSSSDKNIPSLTTVKTWNITVVAPAPNIYEINPQAGKKIELKWDSYVYKKKGAIIQVYRKEGPYEFEPENCQLGIPQGAGYTLVGTTDINQTTFLDSTNLKRGLEYCYRLVVQMPSPAGGISYASNELCARLAIDVPVITHVDIDSTSIDSGVINVKWTRPVELNLAEYTGPYKYEVYRSVGIGGAQSQELVATKTDIMDTTFVDRGLNTERNPYTYKILMYYNSTEPLDTSDFASSVRLLGSGGINSVELSWTYETPWSNTNFKIFRLNEQTNVFDSIGTTTTKAFVDNGIGIEGDMDPDKEYCYYVQSEGSYFNPLLPSPLFNRSQIICQSPKDTIPPCTPVLSIIPIDCDRFKGNSDCSQTDYFNTLNWTDVRGPECKDDIAYYKLYYALDTDSAKFTVIAPQLLDTFFLHKDNPYFYAGCYAVTAVDRSGNESAKSNVVCNDNCPFIEFPNVITPNGDKLNDTFRPYDKDGKCPRFVESIEFIVVNRWGNIVYDSEKTNPTEEKDNWINWNGTMNSGKELATGTYFYTAKVKFIVLDKKKATRTYKGWIQIMR